MRIVGTRFRKKNKMKSLISKSVSDCIRRCFTFYTSHAVRLRHVFCEVLILWHRAEAVAWPKTVSTSKEGMLIELLSQYLRTRKWRQIAIDEQVSFSFNISFFGSLRSFHASIILPIFDTVRVRVSHNQAVLRINYAYAKPISQFHRFNAYCNIHAFKLISECSTVIFKHW